MARARLALCFTLLALLMSIQLSALTDPPSTSPEADAPNSPTQPPLSPSPDISSPPAPPPDIASPPAPPPDIASPPAPPPDSSSPSPSLPPSDDDDDDDENEGPSPSPDDDPEADAPAPEADEWSTMKSGVKTVEKKDEGMSGGKKAGIVIGVFAFAGLAALGGFVYKKRKENMERAAFGAAVRREFL